MRVRPITAAVSRAHLRRPPPTHAAELFEHTHSKMSGAWADDEVDATEIVSQEAQKSSEGQTWCRFKSGQTRTAIRNSFPYHCLFPTVALQAAAKAAEEAKDNDDFPSLAQAAKVPPKAPAKKKKGQKMGLGELIQQVQTAPSSGRRDGPMSEREILMSLPTSSRGKVDGEGDSRPGLGGGFKEYGGERGECGYFEIVHTSNGHHPPVAQFALAVQPALSSGADSGSDRSKTWRRDRHWTSWANLAGCVLRPCVQVADEVATTATVAVTVTDLAHHPPAPTRCPTGVPLASSSPAQGAVASGTGAGQAVVASGTATAQAGAASGTAMAQAASQGLRGLRTRSTTGARTRSMSLLLTSGGEGASGVGAASVTGTALGVGHQDPWTGQTWRISGAGAGSSSGQSQSHVTRQARATTASQKRHAVPPTQRTAGSGARL